MRVFPIASLTIAALVFCCAAPSVAQQSSDPNQVKIVTSDIPRFWQAFDDASKSRDAAKTYAYEYFAPGTPGLWGFVPGRLASPYHLAGVVAKYRAYYESARSSMAQIDRQKPQIYADLRRYKQLYPEAVFPDVYIVVGALNSAGTSVPHVGLVLGAEMLSRPAQMTASLPGFNASVLNTPDKIPGVVVHEFTHYNQHDADTNTLLDGVIVEGSADFMAELVDPRDANSAQWAFGCAHEDALWSRFSAQMNSSDENVAHDWLFSYDPGPLGAPPFIGYWIGSRIAQSYFETHGRSAQAIRDILHVTDYKTFLRDSGYPAHRPKCVTPQ
jgi:Predicted Zn-dependent protease (DUF2268)